MSSTDRMIPSDCCYVFVFGLILFIIGLSMFLAGCDHVEKYCPDLDTRQKNLVIAGLVFFGLSLLTCVCSCIGYIILDYKEGRISEPYV